MQSIAPRTMMAVSRHYRRALSRSTDKFYGWWSLEIRMVVSRNKDGVSRNTDGVSRNTDGVSRNTDGVSRNKDGGL